MGAHYGLRNHASLPYLVGWDRRKASQSTTSQGGRSPSVRSAYRSGELTCSRGTSRAARNHRAERIRGDAPAQSRHWGNLDAVPTGGREISSDRGCFIPSPVQGGEAFTGRNSVGT